MESSYSFIESVENHLVLGKRNGNATDAVRRRRENFHSQRIPDRRRFLSAVRELQEAGIFYGTRWDIGRLVLHVKYG
jgi:hypothetical protein